MILALHRSRGDPNEFWIYETWEGEELVDGESVIWGNKESVAVKGYQA